MRGTPEVHLRKTLRKAEENLTFPGPGARENGKNGEKAGKACGQQSEATDKLLRK